MFNSKVEKELDEFVKAGKLTEEEKERLLDAQVWMQGMSEVYKGIRDYYDEP